MQNIERALQVCIATMAVLGTWMMGLGGHTPFMTPLMFVLAVTGVTFTDFLKWFYLHRAIVNLVAIIAMLLTLTDFLEYDSTGQLLLIAYLLVSWEAVMLFQRKTARVYWCIAVLSLLEVVVASVLNSGMKFGVLLLLYVVVGFFSLVLFFLAREFYRIEDRRRMAVRGGRLGHRASSGTTPSEVPEIVAFGEEGQAEIVSRLPLWRMLRTVSGLGAVSLLFAVIFFYGAPRVGGGWQDQQSPQTQTGFTTQVTLREMGEILQSEQQVMRISFRNHRDVDADYPVFSAPYIYGASLTTYRNGAWRVSDRVDPTRLPLVNQTLLNDTPRKDFLQMQVTLEPVTDSTLFTIPPGFLAAPVRTLTLNRNQDRLIRNPDPEDGMRFRYTLVTAAFQRGIQSTIRPLRFRRGAEVLDESARHECLQLPPAGLPRLAALAADLIEEGNAVSEGIRPSGKAAPSKASDSLNAYDKAQLLTSHFLNDDRYVYTLNFEEVAGIRDPELDPIEDFVVNHRHGHCEYFASALTLMLRSQGVPARLVVGYHGGQRNSLSGDLRIVQSDAHAWVEAYLDPDEIPEVGRIAMGNSRGGAWLRLDPTPGGADVKPSRTQLDDMLDYAQLLWTDYVLEMNPNRQRETLERALGPDNGLGIFRRIRNRTRRTLDAVRNWVDGDWFSWRAGVLASGVCLGLVAVGRLLYPVAVWLGRRRGVTRQRRHEVRVEFYRRLERLLRPLAMIRQPSQTQREFAEQAGARLREVGLGAVADIPLQIAAAFYEVRFGGQGAQTREAEASRMLDQLESEMRKAKASAS